MVNILSNVSNDATKSATSAVTSATTYASTSATSATTFATGTITRSSDTYIYDVDIVAVLAKGTCTFFEYNKKSSQTANKKPSKQNSMLTYDGQENL